MTREIKFRCYDILQNKMIWFDKLVRTDTENLMQFTGLLDKRGKEIYEGDIVKNKYKLQWVVEYIYNGFDPFDAHDGIYAIEVEVIGNIYQNKDLLN